MFCPDCDYDDGKTHPYRDDGGQSVKQRTPSSCRGCGLEYGTVHNNSPVFSPESHHDVIANPVGVADGAKTR